MTTTRHFRLLTVLFALCALLFAQGALAGYLCPGTAKAAEVAQMAEAGMPCAESMSQAMDEQQPGLCHAHCQTAQQSADNVQIPALATLAQLGAVLSIAPAPAEPDRRPLQVPSLRRATAPALAVQHCCFRI